MDRKAYFEKVHDKLAKDFHLTPRQVQRIRQYSLNANMSQDTIIAMLTDKVNKSVQAQQALIRKKLEDEELINFLQHCSADDFIEVTKKYL